MGESELKKALLREGEARARESWLEAESVVETRRNEIKAQLEQMRSEADQKLQADIEELRSNLLFSAQTESRQSRLMAETALAERLYLLAQQLLPGLAADSGHDYWQDCCAELPEANWSRLTVHPGDFAHAKESFPNASIECEPMIGGGLIATNADGTVCIDNSLACRLKRAWPDLLPQLMKELHKAMEES